VLARAQAHSMTLEEAIAFTLQDSSPENEATA
jgi:hypothetical protein